MQLPPRGIAQSGADPRHGAIAIMLGVIDCAQHRPDAKWRALAASAVVADDRQVKRIHHPLSVLGLELDPRITALAREVGSVRQLCYDPLQACLHLLLK